MDLSGVRVREMVAEDAARVAVLAAQLGYPARADEIERRYRGLDRGENEAVLVAEAGGEVVGWVHLRAIFDLLEEPVMEIRGLVVDARCRGGGIGRMLVDAIEEWGLGMGIETARVSSNVTRERAHRFYERLGYEKVKTSYSLVKTLGMDEQRRKLGAEGGVVAPAHELAAGDTAEAREAAVGDEDEGDGIG